ncbi:MAG: hypothetical protein ACI845_002716, partial [Gammaproteobacteria bacterium]
EVVSFNLLRCRYVRIEETEKGIFEKMSRMEIIAVRGD